MYYSKAYSQYGASMGRRDYREHDVAEILKFKVSRVPLNQGGYDPGGAYWGGPANLYVCECETDDSNGIRTTRFFMRAESRDVAKAFVRKQYVNARFYR